MCGHGDDRKVKAAGGMGAKHMEAQGIRKKSPKLEAAAAAAATAADAAVKAAQAAVIAAREAEEWQRFVEALNQEELSQNSSIAPERSEKYFGVDEKAAGMAVTEVDKLRTRVEARNNTGMFQKASTSTSAKLELVRRSEGRQGVEADAAAEGMVSSMEGFKPEKPLGCHNHDQKMFAGERAPLTAGPKVEDQRTGISQRRLHCVPPSFSSLPSVTVDGPID